MIKVKIDREWILKLAKEYDKANPKEEEIEEQLLKYIHKKNTPLKYLNLETLIKITDWKSARVRSYVQKNKEDYVKAVTKASFQTKNEKLKLETLTLLNGVSFRMASAILMFWFPNKYTVMDWRAWSSLKELGFLEGELEDTFECYKAYNDVCIKISKENSVTLRELDKALWQWKGGK